MKRLKRQDIFLTLIFTMIFVFAFSVSGYSGQPSFNNPPVCDANGPYPGECGGSVQLDGTGSFDPDGDPLTYVWDLDNNGTFETSGPMPFFFAPPPPGLVYPVSLIVTDSAGETDECQAEVTVIDTILPEITCPANISRETSSPDGINVDYPPPTSTDTCDSTPDVICDPPSGSLFSVGTTAVNCTSTDDNGNESECSFNVEVLLLTIEVPVDIKPMSCPNPLNVKSKGVLPVAILGTPDFDPANVDISTVELAGVPAILDKYEMEDVATPFSGVPDDDCHDCTEDGPDGLTDLVLHFDSQDIVDAIGSVEDRECLYPTLTGTLLDGTPIEGTDPLLIIKKK